MKGNNGTGNIVDRDDWETPQWLFDLLNKQYNFNVDCCSSKENSKCIGRFDDFKLHMGDTRYIYWMNPPFSKAYEMFEHWLKIVSKGVAIYRVDNMETKVWQMILKKCDWVFIPKGRVAYQYNPEMRKGKGTRFPSALIGIGVPDPKNIEGITLIPKNKGVK